MRKVVITSLIVGIAILGACTNEQTEDLPIQEEEQIETSPTQELKISVIASNTETITEEKSGSKFTIGTLEISIEGNEDAAKKINDELARIQQEYIDNTKAANQMLYDQDNTQTFTHELIYNLVYSDDKVVSIIAEGYENISTAPHPNIFRLSYVFGSQTGEIITLEEILGADYQANIQEFIIDDIKAKGEIDNYYPGLNELIENALSIENWYIKDKMIYFVFNPYQIAPPAFGILEFAYPY